jgi:hypothetical protein
MTRRKHPLSAECLSVSMPTPLATALAKAAEARATSMSSYVRGALFDCLARDGIEISGVRSGNRGQPLPTVVP